MAALALILLVVMVTMNTLPETDSAPTMTCPVSYVKKGCYKDEVSNRRLPDLLAYGRNNLEPGWGNWDVYIPAFICNCANITLHKGYKYFGIQFYAECWGGSVTDAMIQKMEISDKSPDGCVNTKDLGSTCNIEANKMCVGKALANFIYEVQIPTTQPPAAECSDNLQGCEEYYVQGLCVDKYPDVLQNCRKSCKLC